MYFSFPSAPLSILPSLFSFFFCSLFPFAKARSRSTDLYTTLPLSLTIARQTLMKTHCVSLSVQIKACAAGFLLPGLSLCLCFCLEPNFKKTFVFMLSCVLASLRVLIQCMFSSACYLSLVKATTGHPVTKSSGLHLSCPQIWGALPPSGGDSFLFRGTHPLPDFCLRGGPQAFLPVFL